MKPNDFVRAPNASVGLLFIRRHGVEVERLLKRSACRGQRRGAELSKSSTKGTTLSFLLLFGVPRFVPDSLFSEVYKVDASIHPHLPFRASIVSVFSIVPSLSLFSDTEPEMAVTTRQPSSTSVTHSPSTSNTIITSAPRYNNFRPIRYQTKEELERFFGTTSAQKREQRLRVRESDGQVYFDWIEKDEWQHLLATGSLSSPNSPTGTRRRSSAATCLTLNSPLREDRRASLGAGLSGGLFGNFDMVGLENNATSGEERVTRRKRCNSAVAAKGVKVDDRVALSLKGEQEGNWFHTALFTRGQTDGLTWSPRNSYCEATDDAAQEEWHEDRIRISRLPLSRRKFDRETLDQAFGTTAPSDTFSRTTRTHKPRSLTIPFINNTSDGLQLDTATSPTSSCSSSGSRLHSSASLAVANDTVDSELSGERRGTFGDTLLPILRHQHEDSRMTPPSSAAMEFLATPTPTSVSWSQSKIQAHSAKGRTSKPWRHASSFEDSRTAFTAIKTHASTFVDAGWTTHQRHHSAEAVATQIKRPERPLRAVQSVASLRETSAVPHTTVSLQSTVKMEADMLRERTRTWSSSSESSSASDGCVFTSLVPRRGAKKFDKTRHQQCIRANQGQTSPAMTVRSISSTALRDPFACPPAPASLAAPQSVVGTPTSKVDDQDEKHVRDQPFHNTASHFRHSTRRPLRTGPQVYSGLDIPCASIHLHSDPEDNFEPAVALNLTSSQLKKLRKESHAAAARSGGVHTRSPSSSTTNRGRFSSEASVLEGQHRVQAYAKGSSRWWNNILHA